MFAQVDKWVGMEEAADYLGVNKDSIRNWIKKADSGIPAHKIGKQWKFKNCCLPVKLNLQKAIWWTGTLLQAITYF